MIDPKLFLYQAGYLTIKSVDRNTYVLGYPNREVKKAVSELVLPMLLSKSIPDVSNEITANAYSLKRRGCRQGYAQS